MKLKEALATIALQEGQITALELQIKERDEQLYELRLQAQRNEFEIQQLKHALFGDHSEKLKAPKSPASSGKSVDGSSESAQIAGETTTESEQENEERPERKKAKRPRQRLQLDPAVVEEVTKPHFPKQRNCSCCGEALSIIGKEEKVVIERLPVRYQRITHIRYKMACSRCKQARVSLERPMDSIIPGCGTVGVSLAVRIVTNHFADHLPYHRIALSFLREGLQVDRGTLARVASRVGKQLEKLVSVMQTEVLTSSNVVGIDGTGLKIFATPHCDRLSVYVLHADGHVVFRVLEKQSADHVLEGFSQYEGTILTDAAKVFTGEYRASLGLRLALCNAHARRKFFQARTTDRERCAIALSFYRRVAQEERKLHEKTSEERTAQRQEFLLPLFQVFHQWLLQEQEKVPERSPLADAIGYSLRHWEGLSLFLQDGTIEWTNNESERLLRHIVVGRKNWVYRGSFLGAVRGCVLWSLMMSCRLRNINPEKYLTDVLHALSDVPHTQLSDWTPRAYALRLRSQS